MTKNSRNQRKYVEPRPLMTVTDVANHLQVPVKTLYQWRHQGKGPMGIKVGRHIRYRHVDVLAYLDDLVQAER